MECGWKRPQLSRLSNIPVRTIERIETGYTSRPRDDTLQILADALNIDVHELIELRDRGAPELLNDAEPVVPIPKRTEWQAYINAILHKRMVYYIGVPVCVVVAVIFVLTHSLWAPGILTRPVVITGTIVCMNNEPVVGAWYDVFRGGAIDKSISGRVNLGDPPSNGSEKTFAFKLYGDGYNLHVGCGGSSQQWYGTYNTETGSGPVYDHKNHFFICYNAPHVNNFGSCDLKY